jgi:DNA-damage-inducible protein D
MNGDPRKEVIARGQTYFAVKTRQQEFQELFHQLSEDDKRLFLRSDIKQKNMILAEHAKQAGVITSKEFAIFQDAGYRGLYGGETRAMIADRKGVDVEEEILDYMGSEELAANLFRITQTDAAMKRDKVRTAQSATDTHFRVGATVRKAIAEMGGVMPEDLPTEKSIKIIEREKRKSVKA